MIHPDGEIAFFNDAALGIAPCPDELFGYAQRLGLALERVDANITYFDCSGYIRLASENAVVLIDVAPIGPDYLPGHAHADTLSFELSLFGQRFLVNGGTSEYGNGSNRQLERSTAMHNTVVVNGENSSDVWGGFRVGQRAYPRDLQIEKQSNSVVVACSHDGYRRLIGKPTHRRTWQFFDSKLVISDQISGLFEYAVAYFHLHPTVIVSSVKADACVLLLPQGQQVAVKIEEGDARWGISHHSPEFGLRMPTQCLRVSFGAGGVRVLFDWGFFG